MTTTFSNQEKIHFQSLCVLGGTTQKSIHYHTISVDSSCELV